MCDKVQYPNFDKALKSMQYLNRHKGFDLRNTYQCKECGKWHLTSMVSKKKKGYI